MHVATHILCGWNCDNITTVLDGTHKRTYIQQRLTESRAKIQYKDPNNNGSGKRPNTDKIQIGLRVLKISKGTISLPRPSLAGGIPKLTSSDFKPVGCIGIAAPKGSVLVEVLASNTHKISKLDFRGKRVSD